MPSFGCFGQVRRGAICLNVTDLTRPHTTASGVELGGGEVAVGPASQPDTKTPADPPAFFLHVEEAGNNSNG